MPWPMLSKAIGVNRRTKAPSLGNIQPSQRIPTPPASKPMIKVLRKPRRANACSAMPMPRVHTSVAGKNARPLASTL
ncbi:hypothetical protein D1872_312430 [compost metagenome]